MTVLIRPARRADVASLFQVRTSVRENRLTREEMLALGITEESVGEMIEHARCAWVAVDEGKTVGFSMIIPEEACLFAAFILPGYEGKGVGKKLVAEAEQALFKQHQTIWLETGKKSRAAGFYRHLGWGNESDIGDGDIRMEKMR